MERSLLNAWRFSSIMSTAIAMSAAVAHALELRAKRQYEPSLYVRLHRTLYSNFGRIAGPAETLAVMTTSLLAWWTRKGEPSAFPSTRSAAGCLAAAHGIFWGVVQPVNRARAVASSTDVNAPYPLALHRDTVNIHNYDPIRRKGRAAMRSVDV